MAAGLVLLSYWNERRPFVDPFCGSGTIPIEAAMIGRNRAPGMDRAFLSEQWHQIPRELWKQAREEAKDKLRGKPEFPLIASDIDSSVIKLAEQNSRSAGVGGDIQFRTMDVLELKPNHDYGVIICNPPYGERIGDAQSAEAIYDDMADAFLPLSTWSFYILTAHPGFEHFFRRRSDRRRKMYNGRIECTYYQFYGPRPPGDLTSPAESGY